MGMPEVPQVDVEFAGISMENFAGVSGSITLKPLTLLYGPPESGVSHVASLVHAVVVHGASFNLYDDTMETYAEPDMFMSLEHTDLDEAQRVMKRRRQKVRFADSKYLSRIAEKHLHLFAEGLAGGLPEPGPPPGRGMSDFGVTLAANRARGRLEYRDGRIAEFPDRPNLRVHFVDHATALKEGDWRGGPPGPGPYLVREPYHQFGPIPYESDGGMHIDLYRRCNTEAVRNALDAALHYYSERVSQPRQSFLVSAGGLTEYEPPERLTATDLMGMIMSWDRREPTIHGNTPAERLRSALFRPPPGTMVVVENPEKYVDCVESFARTLFEKANDGLYMLVATGDKTLAETVAGMRQKPGVLDPEYAAVYGFEPEGGGHAIIEY